MERRRQSLVNMGHAIRREDGRIRVSKDLVSNLERAEVARVGKAMAAERALTFTAAKTGEYVSGTLVGSTQLASGRFAMIDEDTLCRFPQQPTRWQGPPGPGWDNVHLPRLLPRLGKVAEG